MAKNYSGSDLSKMSDKEIELALTGKKVKIYSEKVVQGKIINFFNYETSNSPDRRIAGVILSRDEYITFTDDIKIEVEDE